MEDNEEAVKNSNKHNGFELKNDVNDAPVCTNWKL